MDSLESLAIAYVKTLFQIPALDTTVQIGNENLSVSAWLQHHQANFAIIITAWNPHSKLLSLSENRQRNECLFHRIGHLPTLPALGVSEDGNWQEESFLVAMNQISEAYELMVKYEQNAIVVCELHKPPYLAWNPSITLDHST